MAHPDGRTDTSPHWLRAIRSPLLLSIVGLWILLLVAESVRPCFFLHDDNATWFIGAYVHDFRVLSETGRLAEVNYYQHGGEPFIEQGQTAVLYPPVYLGVALAKWLSGDFHWSIDWVAAIHLTIGLPGFYFWLRQGGVARGHAALGALAWVLNPFALIVGGSWVFATSIVAWLPWLFWALDLLLNRPSARAALFLGIFASLLFLQGYVQMSAYSFLFLALYVLFQFVIRPETRRPAVFYYLVVAMLVFAILSLPLLLPLLYAASDSAMRPSAMSMEDALFYSVVPLDFLSAQICLFRPNLAFGISTVILFCPALLFIPVMALRLYHGGAEARRRLLPLLILGLLALIFSTHGHALLTLLPVFDKFRWPFKVYLLADFFLIASFVWTVDLRTKSPLLSAWRANLAASVCLTILMLANFAISFAFHDKSTFSETVLPASFNPVAPGMDPLRGRVATFAKDLPDSQAHHYLSHAYATYFAFPSLGGYNPLVGHASLAWALFLDFPNYCRGTITPDFRKDFVARSVRYWIVDSHSPQLQQIEALPGFRQLESDANRVVFEDTQGLPIAYSNADPPTPCAMTYSGNSILISLAHATSPVEVSVEPTDGWWYRVDHGRWLKPVYQDDRLQIDFQTNGQILEVSYFDPPFRQGLLWSTVLLLLFCLLLVVNHSSFKAKNALPHE